MQSYSTEQLPIISTLAQSFAVSDAWFASVPTQTWPNRGFVQTGSSDGHTNNDYYLPWDITTVFDVFTSQNLSWAVYNDGTLQVLGGTMSKNTVGDSTSGSDTIASMRNLPRHRLHVSQYAIGTPAHSRTNATRVARRRLSAIAVQSMAWRG